MRCKRRRVGHFDQRIDTSAHTPISSEPQAVPAHHNDHPPILCQQCHGNLRTPFKISIQLFWMWGDTIQGQI